MAGYAPVAGSAAAGERRRFQVATAAEPTASRASDGEMEVIHRNSNFLLIGRYRSFTQMLKAHLDITRKRIAVLKKGSR
jgi:hypothetical protein